MTASTSSLVLVCAGGTGGHMFPARALAEELIKRGYRVALATDPRGKKYFAGMDHIPQYCLSSAPYLPGLKGKFAVIAALLKGYIQSHRLIKELKPAVVVGFGGYPSAPPVFAAQHRGLPTVLHEQNAILGMANKLLAPWATKIALSWKDTSGLKPAWERKSVITGNPVRADIVGISGTDYPSYEAGITILIVGGSQGAKAFSTIIPSALKLLPDHLKARLNIVQQARQDDCAAVVKDYEGSGLRVEVKSFFDDMPQRLAESHVLIARSGASTIAENTVAGRPAIYVPFPWNRDNQQVFNAKVVEAVGGGQVLLEKDMTPSRLCEVLRPWLEHPDRMAAAGHAATVLGQPMAARNLADEVAFLTR